MIIQACSFRNVLGFICFIKIVWCISWLQKWMRVRPWKLNHIFNVLHAKSLMVSDLVACQMAKCGGLSQAKILMDIQIVEQLNLATTSLMDTTKKMAKAQSTKVQPENVTYQTLQMDKMFSKCFFSLSNVDTAWPLANLLRITQTIKLCGLVSITKLQDMGVNSDIQMRHTLKELQMSLKEEISPWLMFKAFHTKIKESLI